MYDRARSKLYNGPLFADVSISHIEK